MSCEHQAEMDSLLQGRFVVIDNKPDRWWEKHVRSGFFAFLEDENYPVKVLCGSRLLYFGTGPTKKQVAYLRTLPVLTSVGVY